MSFKTTSVGGKIKKIINSSILVKQPLTMLGFAVYTGPYV